MGRLGDFKPACKFAIEHEEGKPADLSSINTRAKDRCVTLIACEEIDRATIGRPLWRSRSPIMIQRKFFSPTTRRGDDPDVRVFRNTIDSRDLSLRRRVGNGLPIR